MASAPVIHLVEADAAVRDALEALFLAHGLSVKTYESGEHLLLSPPAAGCVVASVGLPGRGGLALLAALRSRAPKVRVVILSGRLLPALAPVASRLGASDFLVKPFPPDLIVEAVLRALTATAPQGRWARLLGRLRRAVRIGKIT